MLICRVVKEREDWAKSRSRIVASELYSAAANIFEIDEVTGHLNDVVVRLLTTNVEYAFEG